MKKQSPFVLLLLLVPILAWSQVTVIQSPVPQFRSFTPLGVPNTSGCVYTFATGTSTPQATYTDSTGTVTNTNPVILDATGSASIWISSAVYRFQVWTFGSGSVGSNCGGGTQIYQIDGVRDTGLNALNGPITLAPTSNGIDIFDIIRATDVSPSGNFVNFKSFAGASLFKIDINGNVTTAGTINTQVYVAPGSSIQAAINALPVGGGIVNLSPGIYAITSAIVPKPGTNLQCTNTGWANTYDSAGCVIQPTSGNGIWGIQGPSSGTLTNYKATDITIDLTADSSALGCVDLIRTLYSEQYNVHCLLPTTGSMNGFQFDGTAFSYWNKCYGCSVLSTAPGTITNTHIGFHFTALANSDWCVNCLGSLIGTIFQIDSGNQIEIIGGGGDHVKDNCLNIASSVNARGNVIEGIRCDESFQAITGAAVTIGALAVDNVISDVFVTGAGSAGAVVTDNSAGHNYIRVTDTAGQYTNTVFANANQNVQVGVNKTPTVAVDVHGEIASDGSIGYFHNLAGGMRIDGKTNAGVENTLVQCNASDLCQLRPIGTGGLYIATTGGTSAFGFNPSSFGNALVPFADNTYSLGANTVRWADVRFAGNIKPGTDNLLISSTAPTITTHFNTSGDSIVTNGTASFTITVGTGAATQTGVITLPTASSAWNCWLTNQTRPALVLESAASTTTATFTNLGTTFTGTNWTNGDVLRGGCVAN